MERETITQRQAVCIITVFLLGSSIILGMGTSAEQDTWASLLLAAVEAILIALVYSRIIRLFPGKDLYEIIEALFGKVLGKVFTVLICWYAIHLCALVMKNFSEFIEITAMPETPELPLMIMIVLVAVYIVKSGAETLGKWSVVMLIFIGFVVILTFMMSLNKIDLSSIQPILSHKPSEIAAGSFSTFTFPFAETVLFLALAGTIKRTDSPKRIYISSILIGCGILLLVFIRNICMLGVPLWKSEYFPSYMAVRVIHVADYLMRVEGMISINFLLAGVTKVTVCLFAASKGLASLFGVKDYKQMTLPAALLALALCAIVYKNVMEMMDFAKITYQYYAIPFQIIIPLIIWITAEIRTKRGKQIVGA